MAVQRRGARRAAGSGCATPPRPRSRPPPGRCWSRPARTRCTLRAIAREMGMTAPALYRYFGSHEDLVAALYQDLLAEITATLEQARDTVGRGRTRSAG